VTSFFTLGINNSSLGDDFHPLGHIIFQWEFTFLLWRKLFVLLGILILPYELCKTAITLTVEPTLSRINNIFSTCDLDVVTLK